MEINIKFEQGEVESVFNFFSGQKAQALNIRAGLIEGIADKIGNVAIAIIKATQKKEE